jgi:prepilin-type N-terminal cleavage/methylation domain-containing protein
MCVRRDCARRADERGLTLIELLVTIAILGIIAVPLALALTAYFRHTDETTDRLSLSHDAQISSAYFAQDVASMGRRDWSAAGFPSAPSLYTNLTDFRCGSGDQLVVRLLTDDPVAARGSGGVLRIAYWLTVAGGEHQLHRQTCDKNGALTSDIVLAHNVDTVRLGCPLPTACTDVPDPAQVQLSLGLKKQSGGGTVTVAVTLLGERRQT